MTPYQIKKQKRRTLISVLSAILLHFLIIGGFLIYDCFFVEDLSEFSGPVLVKLGEPAGEDIPVLPEKKPETLPDQPLSTPAPPSPPVESPSEASVPAVQPEVKQETPVLPAKPVDSPQETSTASSVPQESAPVTPAPVVPSEPKTVEVKGDEAGNSTEYQFNAEEGVIKRSLGAAIYLYMPLPKVLSGSLMNSIQGDSYNPNLTRQDIIKKYYREINGDYFYDSNTSPPTDDVTAIWSYLIKAGYDFKKADYKSSGFDLRPVVISFTISGDGTLLNVEPQSSSGNSDVDKAVLEGFKEASFSNTSGRNIKGRFTYRFE